MRSLALVPVLAALALAACDACGGGDPLGRFAPQVRLDPEELSLGPTPLGAAELVTLRVFNDGNAPAELLGDAILDADEDAGLRLVSADFPLSGGLFVDIEIAFQPRREGTYTGQLHLPFAPPLTPTIVPITAEAEPADVVFEPTELVFDALAAGDSATRTITVRNRTDATLAVPLTVDGGGFRLSGQVTQIVDLAGGASVDVDVTFSPSRGGGYETLLWAELCGTRCGPFATLLGEGLAPRIEARPRPVDFGEVPSLDRAVRTITLENVGVGNLTLSAMTPFDEEDRVELVDAPDLPVVLAAGETLLVDVSFTAGAPDAQAQSSLRIDSNDPLSPRVSVPITASIPGAALRVAPAAAHFGRLDAGESRRIDVVALSRGTAPVTVESINLQAADASAFSWPDGPPPVPVELAPGESLLFGVQADATTAHEVAGGATARLVFSTAETPDEEIALAFVSGSAGCQPTAPTSALNLGGMRLGQGGAGKLEIVNAGDAPCTLDVDASGPAAGLPSDPGFSWDLADLETLGPGERGDLRFAFSASTEGTFSTWLTLRWQPDPGDPNLTEPEPTLVSATARGVLGSLVAEPPSLTFGPYAQGCDGRVRGVNFVNDGTASVTVSEINATGDVAKFNVTSPQTPLGVVAGSTMTVIVDPVTDEVGTFDASIIATSDELGDVIANMTLLVEAPGAPITETFLVEASGTNKVDVLFIVDNSGSMLDDQEILATNFEIFIQQANQPGTNIDYHMGVTTADVLSEFGTRGRLISPPAVLTSTTPDLLTQFQSHARVGADGHFIELGLEAMRLALSEPNRSGPNAGFLRADAALSIIVVSDEDDNGDDSGLSNWYPQGVPSPQGYIAFLDALKTGSIANVPILFSLVGSEFGMPRYNTLVSAYGGVAIDIDDVDWGQRLGQLGQQTFDLARTFRVTSPPADGSVEVLVDGTPLLPTEYVVNGVVITLNDEPPPGATVEITYTPDCS
jgi:hypothetical protein